MRVLVTGSSGQVGSWTLDRAPAGHQVQRLDLRDAHPVDIRSPDAAALVGKADLVIHLAALIDVAASMEDPAETRSVNVEGTRNLAAALRPGSRFVLASSAAVYGDAGRAATSEDAATRPLSPYGHSKLEAEQVVRELAADRRAEAVIVRPFNIYSSRQDPASPYAGVITAFVRAAAARRPFRIDGDGMQTRDFVHARDVADFLWLVGREKAAAGTTFNVATGTSITIRDLAARVQRACDVDLPLQEAPARPGDVRHSHADVRRAHGLGWRAAVGLDEGLRETAAGLVGGTQPRRRG